MTKITLEDDTTGEKVVLTFTPTDTELQNGQKMHTIDLDCQTNIDDIKESATPMFKSAMFILLNAFGLSKQKEK